MKNFKFLNLSGEVNSSMEDLVTMTLLQNINRGTNKENLVFLINSDGHGNLINAINIYNMLKAHDVYTVVTGQCSHLAVLIFLAASDNKRFALPYTIMNLRMIKNSVRQPEDFQIMDNCIHFAEDIIAKNLNLERDDISSLFDKNKIIDCNEFEKFNIAKVIPDFNSIIINDPNKKE